MPPHKRSFTAMRHEPTMIDTTPLEAIDEEGDLLLRLTYPKTAKKDTETWDVDMKSESDVESLENIAEKWQHTRDINFLISSKHMMLVSPVFKGLLKNNAYRESAISQASGKVELGLLHDDPDAFRILLNIVHGRTRQVPLCLNLATFSQIALSVERHQMTEVIELYVKIWIEKLPKPAQGVTTEEDILHWICICLVFKLSAEFKCITRYAVWETAQKIEVPALEMAKLRQHSVIARILDKIESQRKLVTFNMLSSVQIINNNCLHNTEDACSYTEMGAAETSSRRTACNALMLGSLTKSAFDNGIWPLPQKPYSGLTLRKVMDAARCLRVISMCDTLSGRSLTDGHGAHGYMKSIKRSVDKREAEAEGLNLEDFLSKGVVSLQPAELTDLTPGPLGLTCTTNPLVSQCKLARP